MADNFYERLIEKNILLLLAIIIHIGTKLQ